MNPVRIHLFRFVEQLFSRAPHFPLHAVLAGKFSSHKGIAKKSKDEEKDDENDNCPRKTFGQKNDPCDEGDKEYQKVGNDILPGNLQVREMFFAPPRKKQGTKTAFSKSAGFPVVITVDTVTAQEAILKEKNEYYISCDKEDAEIEEDIDPDTIDQDRQKIGYDHYRDWIILKGAQRLHTERWVSPD